MRNIIYHCISRFDICIRYILIIFLVHELIENLLQLTLYNRCL